jgi:hypothetical protein
VIGTTFGSEHGSTLASSVVAEGVAWRGRWLVLNMSALDWSLAEDATKLEPLFLAAAVGLRIGVLPWRAKMFEAGTDQLRIRQGRRGLRVLLAVDGHQDVGIARGIVDRVVHRRADATPFAKEPTPAG